jgi:DNA polymerase V
MAVTRSFGEAVTTLDGMLEAVSTYATRAGEKLRARGLATAAVTVFMHTNRFNGDPPYSGARTVEPAEATNDTLALVGIATLAARRIWRGGFRYSKAGILLNDLVKVECRQRSLLVDPVATERQRRLMKAVDQVNAMNGRGTLFPASAGIRKAWSLRAEHRSPRWTTRIEDLPEVR